VVDREHAMRVASRDDSSCAGARRTAPLSGDFATVDEPGRRIVAEELKRGGTKEGAHNYMASTSAQ
jgi:hypothetical protein